MPHEEYLRLIYGEEAVVRSVELQRARTEMLANERRQISNTELIHLVLRRSIATAKLSTDERIRRAGTTSLLT